MHISLIRATIALGLCIAMASSKADMFEPSHHCSKPIKPYRFTSQWEIDSFKDDVNRYKRCIQEFVEEQNDAVNKHRAAAESAIEDWNTFVRRELN